MKMNHEEKSGERSGKIKDHPDRYKKFVRYQEGAEMYSMGLTSFTSLAKEAKAVYKKGQLVLVNVQILDEYLELFREL